MFEVISSMVEEGTRGELVVRGHSMMLGYFGDPENTARAIDAQGWLHTGDEGLFRMHRGRPIYFVTGRLKEIIIRDADKYSPLRLERRLVEALPEISGRVVVLGFPHREHGAELLGGGSRLAAVRQQLREVRSRLEVVRPERHRPLEMRHVSTTLVDCRDRRRVMLNHDARTYASISIEDIGERIARLKRTGLANPQPPAEAGQPVGSE